MYNIQLASKAVKFLKDLPDDYRNSIKQKISILQTDPKPRGSIQLVGHDNCFRFRIGPFRVQYIIIENEKSILIYKISRRNENTYG